MSGKGALLTVKDLKTWFPVRSGVLRRVTGHVRAVDGVEFSINEGETFALVGESGCGKTTVGKSILKLIESTGGSVDYRGRDILSLSTEEFAPLRQDIQIVLQDPGSALDPRMTIRDAIAEGLDAFGLYEDRSDRTEKVVELMRKVALDPDMMDRYPHEFSGGQRQRICIARALALEPKLIICDEAVSALDVSIQAQILNLLNDLKSSNGITFLFITHDLSVVRYFADQVAIMYLGQIVESGPTERIFEQPRHPYTKALLSSIPSIDPDRRSSTPVTLDEVPSPEAPPAGCHYHPRCPVALDKCRTHYPARFDFDDGASSCWLSELET